MKSNDAGTSNKEVVEPIVSNKYAVIVPHNRDKGGFGYAIAPSWQNAYTLTDDELMVLLSVYTQLLKLHNEQMHYEWSGERENDDKTENR